MMEIRRLYENRFDRISLQQRKSIWKVLCDVFFQKYVMEEATVLDIGAGYCEFINHIRCKKKFAVDLHVETSKFANPDVTVLHCSSTNLSFLTEACIDVVFISNLLEHLKTKDDVIETLSEAFRVLKSEGLLIIVQPNIRYLYEEYWDFFDHHIPLSDKSLVEALEMVGFHIEKVIPRFLPYTTKSKIPKNSVLVSLYLKIPLIWRIMGKQMFILGKKRV